MCRPQNMYVCKHVVWQGVTLLTSALSPERALRDSHIAVFYAATKMWS